MNMYKLEIIGICLVVILLAFVAVVQLSVLIQRLGV